MHIEIFQNFIKFENMLLMKSWGTHIVKENFQNLNEIFEEKKRKQEQEKKGGMFSFIGSMLGSAS